MDFLDVLLLITSEHIQKNLTGVSPNFHQLKYEAADGCPF